MRIRIIVLVAALSALATSAFAQTNPVAAGSAFNVAYDHDGQNVTGFQCTVDGLPSGAVLSAAARTCAIPGQTAGTHTVRVEAINAFGRAASAPLTVTAGSGPSAPTNLRVVVQIALQPSGEVQMLTASVSREP